MSWFIRFPWMFCCWTTHINHAYLVAETYRQNPDSRSRQGRQANSFIVWWSGDKISECYARRVVMPCSGGRTWLRYGRTVSPVVVRRLERCTHSFGAPRPGRRSAVYSAQTHTHGVGNTEIKQSQSLGLTSRDFTELHIKKCVKYTFISQLLVLYKS